MKSAQNKEEFMNQLSKAALSAALALSMIVPSTIYAQEQDTENVNTNAAIYKTLEQQQNALSTYPILTQAGFEPYSDETEKGTYVIPGLDSTLTLDDQDKVERCNSMTPQGVAMADDYILISAYCHEHEHHSVLYVLSRNTHEYVKTIVLDGKPHAGSIAYDPIARNVWIATKDHKNDTGSASFIKLANLDAYDFTKDKAPLKYDYSIDLPQLRDDSFMTCYNRQLYCGYFSKHDNSVKTYIYDINEADGKLDTTKRHVAKAYGFDKIGDNCQGIAIDDKHIYLSSSDGPKSNSTLSIFEKSEHSLLTSNAQKNITLPPRLEQIYPTGNGGLLTMYESASSAYRDEGSTIVDRVVTMNIEDMLKN